MADVTIDAAASFATERGMRSVVFTDANTGYFFFVDGDNDFKYVKTTDGGATWGSPVAIGNADTDLAYDVWFDQWTPGDSGTLIHCWWFGSVADDVQYRTVDTGNSDTLGTLRVIFAGATAAAGRGVFVSGTKTRSGYLYCAYDIDAGAERGFHRSTDGGATWSANLSTTFVEATIDQCLLFPASNTGDNNDCWAVYHDASANALTLKMWDSSAVGATESATIATVTENTTDLTGQYPFSASVRHSDGHLIVSAITERDTATADHRVFDINGTGSISELTAITTNIDDHYYQQVFIDQTTDDIYVAYNGKRDGSETLGTSTKIYYTKSTDDGTTWSAGDTAYMEAAAGAMWQVYAPLMGPRFYVAWINGSAVVFGNKVNSVTFAAGNDQIAGTSSPAFTNTGTLTGKGALAGAAAQAFTNTAVLTADGALAGAADLAFVNSATLRYAPSLISGAADLAFANSATLTADGALAGAAAQAFSNTALLEGTGALAGAAAQAFANSGALIGRAPIAGSADQAFSNSAALTADGALAGVAELAFANTGTLNLPSGAIAGTADLVFSNTAVLTADGALAGAAAQAFTNTAVLTADGALAGSTDVSFSTTAALLGRAALAGEAGLVFVNTATPTQPGALSGQASLTFAGQALLAGTGELAGSVEIHFVNALRYEVPIFGWGARGAVGTHAASPETSAIGAGVADPPLPRIGAIVGTDRVGAIGNTTATGEAGRIGSESA